MERMRSMMEWATARAVRCRPRVHAAVVATRLVARTLPVCKYIYGYKTVVRLWSTRTRRCARASAHGGVWLCLDGAEWTPKQACVEGGDACLWSTRTRRCARSSAHDGVWVCLDGAEWTPKQATFPNHSTVQKYESTQSQSRLP